jgi:ankyrin repeat protein
VLLKHGATIDARDAAGNTALMNAAGGSTPARHTGAMELLLKAGANANLADVEGKTALMIAIDHYNDDNAVTLVKHGADLELRDNASQSALDRAAGRGDGKLTKRLVEARRTQK